MRLKGRVWNHISNTLKCALCFAQYNVYWKGKFQIYTYFFSTIFNYTKIIIIRK